MDAKQKFDQDWKVVKGEKHAGTKDDAIDQASLPR